VIKPVAEISVYRDARRAIPARQYWQTAPHHPYVVIVQPTRLVFSDLITEAFSRVTGNMRTLVDIALIPTIISVGLQLCGRWLAGDQMGPLEAMAVKLADFVPTTMFAVAWYRLVLLGPGSVGARPGFGWTARERGYLWQLLLIAAIPIVLHAFFWVMMPWPVEMPGPGEPLPPGVEAAMPLGFGFTVTAIIALRLSFGLVAPSVDVAWTPHLSWRYGKGNGATILFSLLLMIVVGVIVKAISMAVLLALALGMFGGPLSLGPWLVVSLLAETIAYVMIAPLVTVQALIFRSLTGWTPAGPTRQPPP
jgi:hypothetical protein